MRAPGERSVRMWITMSEAHLILTGGLPGAGKSTREAVSPKTGRRASHQGSVALGPRFRALGAPTQQKIEHELWQLAQQILRLGLSVVLDFGLWARGERDRCDPWLVALASGSNCTTSTCLPTNSGDGSMSGTRSRPGTAIRSAGTDLDGWIRLFSPDAAELALFDPPPNSSYPAETDSESVEYSAVRQWHARTAARPSPTSWHAAARRTGTLGGAIKPAVPGQRSLRRYSALVSDGPARPRKTSRRGRRGSCLRR